MDGIASIGVGVVAGRTLSTASASPAAVQKSHEFTGDIASSALKLIQSVVVNSPGPEHALNVRA